MEELGKLWVCRYIYPAGSLLDRHLSKMAPQFSKSDETAINTIRTLAVSITRGGKGVHCNGLAVINWIELNCPS